VIIKSIKANDFMKYEFLSLDKLPESGLIGIFGENEAGKTTIGEAITFGLFGKTVRSDNLNSYESVIRWSADSTSVELVFSVNNEACSIKRTLNRNGEMQAFLLNYDKGIILEKELNKVNEKIINLIGLSFNEFRYSSYVAQKELSIILSGNTTSIVKSMLGFDILTKAEKQLLNSKPEISNKIETLDFKISELRKKLDNLESELDYLESLKLKFENLTEEIENLKNKKQELLNQLELLSDKEKLEEKKGIRNELENTISELKMKYEELKEKKSEYESFINIMQNKKSEFEDLKAQLNYLKEQKVNALKINSLKSNIYQLQIKESKNLAILANLEKLNAELDKKLKEIEVLNEGETELKEKLKKIKEGEKKIKEFNLSIDEGKVAKNRLKSLANKRESYIEFAAKVRDLDAKLNELKDIYKKRFEKVKYDYEKKEKHIKALKEELSGIIKDSDKFKALKNIDKKSKTYFKITIFFVLLFLASIISFIYFLNVSAASAIYSVVFGIVFAGLALVFKNKSNKLQQRYESENQLCLNKIEDLKKQIDDGESELIDIHNNMEDLKKEIKIVNSLFVKAGKDLKIIKEKLSERKFFKDEIKNILNDIAHIIELYPEFSAEETEISIKKKEFDEEYEILNKKHIHAISATKEVEYLNQLIKEKEKLSESHERIIDGIKKLEEQVEKIREEIELEEKKLSENNVKEEVDRLNDEINNINSKYFKDIEFNENTIIEIDKKIEEVEKNIANLQIKFEKAEFLKKDTESLSKEMQSLESELKEKREQVEKLNKEIKIKELELKQSLKDNLEKETLELEIANIDKVYFTKEREIFDISKKIDEIDKITEEHKSVMKQLADLRAQRTAYESKLQVIPEVIKYYKLTQSSILNTLIPNMEKYFSYILPRITDNRYQKVKIDRETFNIKVYSKEKDDFVPISSLSGGTEDLLLLSLRLAFSEAVTPIKARKKYKDKFLFLDEPLSSFDKGRQWAFLNLMKFLEGHFKQIFVISHLPGIESFMDYYIETSISKTQLII